MNKEIGKEWYAAHNRIIRNPMDHDAKITKGWVARIVGQRFKDHMGDLLPYDD